MRESRAGVVTPCGARGPEDDAGDQGDGTDGRVQNDRVRFGHVDAEESGIDGLFAGEEREAGHQQGDDADGDQDQSENTHVNNLGVGWAGV